MLHITNPTPSEDIEDISEILEKYIRQLNRYRIGPRKTCVIIWIIFTYIVFVLRNTPEMTTTVIVMGYLIPVIGVILIRASLILYLRHVYVMDYIHWHTSLSFIMTGPLIIGSGREYAESQTHELEVRQGCYVRILNGWRLSLVNNQYLFEF